jgi:hypothetical protein
MISKILMKQSRLQHISISKFSKYKKIEDNSTVYIHLNSHKKILVLVLVIQSSSRAFFQFSSLCSLQQAAETDVENLSNFLFSIKDT